MSDPQSPTPPTPKPPLLEAMRVLSLVTTAIAIMVILGGLGYGIDHYFQITAFSLLGFAAGGYLGIRYLIQALEP